MKNLLMLLVLVGCAHAPEKIKGPDGSLNDLVYCTKIKDCYTEASKICGKYQIINSTSEASLDGIDVKSISNQHQLLVKCLGK